MLRLGQVRQGKEVVRWKDWVSSGELRDGDYPVLRILKPMKYPSGAIIFDVGPHLVKLTMPKETLKEIAKFAGLSSKRDTHGVLVMVIKNGEYGVDWRPSEKRYYQPTEWGWALREIEEQQAEEETEAGDWEDDF